MIRLILEPHNHLALIGVHIFFDNTVGVGDTAKTRVYLIRVSLDEVRLNAAVSGGGCELQRRVHNTLSDFFGVGHLVDKRAFFRRYLATEIEEVLFARVQVVSGLLLFGARGAES